MPYKAFPEGSQHCVYKIDSDGNKTGKSLGCHDKKSEADDQVAALYASENKNKPPDGMLELIKSRPSKGAAGFVVYKSQDGKTRWLARFSNNIRDDDHPVKEILSGEAQRRFAYMVTKGLVPYPDLWVWHEEQWLIGKSDWIATDEVDGIVFNLASGEVYPHAEEVAVTLGNMEDMGMSHGMIPEYMERDDEDPSVITGFVSKELSILPRWSAANKFTSVHIFNTESQKMVKDEKKAALDSKSPGAASLLGIIEQSNAEIAGDVKGLGLETKEKGESEEEKETGEDTAQEAPANETDSKQADEGEAETQDPVDQKEEGVDETETAESDDAEQKSSGVDRDEVVAALKAVGDRLGDIETAIINVNERVQSLEEGETRRKEQPVAKSLVELISGSSEQERGGLKSVIGSKQTKVDGRSSLAKSKPEETEDKAKKGLFFEDFLES